MGQTNHAAYFGGSHGIHAGGLRRQKDDTSNASAGNTGTDSTQTNTANNTENQGSEDKLSGTIEIDGSSTVYPMTEAIAEEFGKEHSAVRVSVGTSGTGGGFKRFAAGETAISNASRPIKDKEAEDAKANGIEYLELTVAYDGLSIVVNKDNSWVDKITLDELKKSMSRTPKSKRGQMCGKAGRTRRSKSTLRARTMERSTILRKRLTARRKKAAMTARLRSVPIRTLSCKV